VVLRAYSESDAFSLAAGGHIANHSLHSLTFSLSPPHKF